LLNYLGNHFNSIVDIKIESIEGKKVVKICVKGKAPEPVFLNQKENLKNSTLEEVQVQ